MATIAVISLVVLAGGSRQLEFLEKRISPVDASIVRAARDLIISAKQLEELRKKTRTDNSKQNKKACF
ncbi:MAG: hypothetical protein ABSF48_07520 [Thermodesulfobacteriota bacterium]|jgi:hypothetical protein